MYFTNIGTNTMKISISPKIGLIIVVVLSAALIVVFGIMLVKSETSMMDTAENNVNDINTLIVNSVNFAVGEGITSVEPYIEMLKDVSDLKEVRLIPSNVVREDSEILMDDEEKLAFNSGKSKFQGDKGN